MVMMMTAQTIKKKTLLRSELILKKPYILHYFELHFNRPELKTGLRAVFLVKKEPLLSFYPGWAIFFIFIEYK